MRRKEWRSDDSQNVHQVLMVFRFARIPTPSVRFAAMLPASLIGFVCQPYGMAGIFSSGENHKTRLEEGALWGRAFLEVLKVKSITLRKAQTIFLINP